jgi:uncharacterized RDD family membrane protein YckC
MQNSSSSYPTPSLKRRLICLVYEAFLVIAVGALAVFVFMFSMQKFSGRIVEQGPKMVAFLAVGAYLIHSWAGSGFTLAMKTWRIKLVKVGYARVPFRNAALRYLFSSGWVLPGGLIYYVLGRHDWKYMALSILGGVILWALTVFLDKDRQFLHDKLAGTRLISLPKPVKAAKT